MTLDEARAILKGKPGSIDALGDEYVWRAYAAERLGDYYRAHPELTTPLRSTAHTTDAAPRTAPTDGASAMQPPPKPHMGLSGQEYVAAMWARNRWEEARKRTKDGSTVDWSKALRDTEATTPGMGPTPCPWPAASARSEHIVRMMEPERAGQPKAA